MVDHHHEPTGPTPRPVTDDELMARLSRARPLTPEPLPLADGPEARHLLETIMQTDSPTDRPEPANEPVADSAPSLDPVLFAADGEAGFTPPQIAPRRRRGYGAILAAAAAVVLLVGAVVTFLPTNTEPALAAVQSAAQATAESTSGRIAVSVDFEATGELGSGGVDATVDGLYSGDDLAFEITSFATEGAAQEIDDEFGPDGLPVDEVRYVDGVLYTELDGEGWIGVEVPAFLGTELADLADPRQVLVTVQELVAATEVGPETITGPDGVDVATTRYVSEVDLGDESLAESGWVAGLDVASIDADGTVTVAFNVDDDGLLRRLSVTGTMTEPDGVDAGSGSASFAIVTSFYDIGGAVDIEAPEGAEIIDPMEELEGFDGSFDDLDEFETDLDDVDPEG